MNIQSGHHLHRQRNYSFNSLTDTGNGLTSYYNNKVSLVGGRWKTASESEQWNLWLKNLYCNGLINQRQLTERLCIVAMKSDTAFSHGAAVHPSEGLTYQLLCMAHPRSPSLCPFPSILSLPQRVAEERWYLWRRQQKHFYMWCLCKWKLRRWRGKNIAPMMTNTFVSWYILLFLMRTFCWTEWLLVNVL